MNGTDTSRLWTLNGFHNDIWVHAEDIQALSAHSHVILPLAAFIDLEEDIRIASSQRIGLRLEAGDRLDSITTYLSLLPLVCLVFPAFADGRSYSKATLLRERHGYTGVIRAAGDVLIDQIPLMLRTGFSEFEVSNQAALKRLDEKGRPDGIAFHYQPSPASQNPIPQDNSLRFSWRRLPAA